MSKHKVLKLVVREHAFDGVGNNAVRMGSAHFFESRYPHAARITGMAVVKLLSFFTAGNFDEGGVDNNYVVAPIDMAGKSGLVLAH